MLWAESAIPASLSHPLLPSPQPLHPRRRRQSRARFLLFIGAFKTLVPAPASVCCESFVGFPPSFLVDVSSRPTRRHVGVYDSEAGPSRVESLYEEHISSMSKSASPKPWTRDTSSEDVQIVEADNVPVHIKGEREDTAELAEIQEISRSSAGLPRSMSSFSPDIQSQSGVKSKRSRATASRAGGIEASRPVGFEVSPPPRC